MAEPPSPQISPQSPIIIDSDDMSDGQVNDEQVKPSTTGQRPLLRYGSSISPSRNGGGLRGGEMMPKDRYSRRRRSTSPGPSPPMASRRTKTRSVERRRSPAFDPPRGPKFDPPRRPRSVERRRSAVYGAPRGPRVDHPQSNDPDYYPPLPPRDSLISRMEPEMRESRGRGERDRSRRRSPRRDSPSSPRRGRESRVPSWRSERSPRRSPRRESPARRRRYTPDYMSPTRRRSRHYSRSPDRHVFSRRRERSRSRDRRSPSRRRRHSRSPDYSRKRTRYESPQKSSRHRSRERGREPYRDHETKPSNLKVPQEKFREAMESDKRNKGKTNREPEPPQLDVRDHQPELSFDNQSADGFMDLDEIIAAAANKVSTKPPTLTASVVSKPIPSNMAAPQDKSRKVVSFDTWGDEPVTSSAALDTWGEPEPAVNQHKPRRVVSFDTWGDSESVARTTSPDRSVRHSSTTSNPTTMEGIHPSRLRRLSDDMGEGEVDDQILDTLPKFLPNSKGSGSNSLPVGPRKTTSQGARTSVSGFNPPSAATVPSSPVEYDDPWGAPASSDNVSQSSHTNAAPSSSMPPPPITAAPSLHRALSTPPLPTGPPRTRQQIFDDFCVQKDAIIKADTDRRAANGTVPYVASDDEIAVILARMSFNPGPLALATRDFSAKDNEPFLKHKEDLRFIPKTPRVNERGKPLTSVDEEVSTYQKLRRLGEGALREIARTRPGERVIETRFDREEKARRERMGRAEAVALEKKNGGEVMAQQLASKMATPSKEDVAEATALAEIADLIDVDLEL